MPTRFTVLTYNVGLLRVRVLGATFNEPVPCVNERLQALPGVLAASNADVITLQEIYDREHRMWLVHELRKHYPYASFVQDDGLIRVSNGLLTLSRGPQEEPIFERFRHAPFGEQRLANKGFLSCVVQTNSFGFVRIFNVHLASGGILGYTVNPKHVHSRGKQLEQLIRAVRERREEKVLVAGDFNAGPEASPENYRAMLAEGYLDAYAEANVRRGPLVTWDPQNPLSIDGTQRKAPAQRVDHVFIPPFAARTFHVERADIVFDHPTVETQKEGPVTPSDHYGLIVQLYRL